jgi:hypothetical protein
MVAVPGVSKKLKFFHEVNMREVIADIVKHTEGLGFIEDVKITGTLDETKIEAMDANKTVFVKGRLIKPVAELEGQFGLSSLSLLNRLLNFASYRTDEATFSVKRRDRNGVEVPEQFLLRDSNGEGADFRLMSAELVPDQAIIANIPWDIKVQPKPSKVQEFSQLASFYNEFEKWFSVKTTKDGLVFYIGDENSASHRVSMLFEKDVTGTFKGDWNWPSSQVLSILKLAGSNPSTIMCFSSKGAMQVSVTSDYGTYDYVLPARRRG